LLREADINFKHVALQSRPTVRVFLSVGLEKSDFHQVGMQKSALEIGRE
jgi:hypothetical protein